MEWPEKPSRQVSRTCPLPNKERTGMHTMITYIGQQTYSLTGISQLQIYPGELETGPTLIKTRDGQCSCQIDGVNICLTTMSGIQHKAEKAKML